MVIVKKVSILFVIILLISLPVHASMQSFTSGPFDATLDIAADLSGDFSFSDPTEVTGLSKFDPNLGTLTNISFDITTGAFNYSADLFGEPVSGMDFIGEFTTSIQADLVYATNGFGLVLDGIPSSIDMSCSGIDGDSCSDNVSDMFDFASDGLAINRPLSDFDLTDFVGNGDVDNLSLQIALLGTSFPESDGFNFLEVFGSAEISGAFVEITYEFTPVPLPAGIWLFGSGLLALLLNRKRNELN